MNPSELVSSVSAPIGRLGAAFYFTPETTSRGKAVGLDGFRLYFLGRGGVLGDVDWPVVLSAFGYFKPTLVQRIWTTGRERYPVRDAAQLYLGACRDHGRAHFGDVENLDTICQALEAVMDAAMVDPAGLTLFAGIAGQPLADDLPARAMQLVTTLREYRGSAHLVAVTAVGLSRPVAHRIRRPNDVEAFGWGADEIPVPTDDDLKLLGEADALTDKLVLPAWSVLDGETADTVARGIEQMEAAP